MESQPPLETVPAKAQAMFSSGRYKTTQEMALERVKQEFLNVSKNFCEDISVGKESAEARRKLFILADPTLHVS